MATHIRGVHGRLPIEELDVPISLYLGSSVKRVYIFSCSICSQQIATVKSQKGSLNK